MCSLPPRHRAYSLEDLTLNKTKIFLLFIVFIFFGAIASYILVDIVSKKSESKAPFARVIEIGMLEDDPALWGQNYPLQYASYLLTSDQVRTRYGGSEALPRTPTKADPRSIVSQSKLEEDPRLKIMWQGYPFSIDMREERGHAYMLIDQIHTQRQMVTKQPAACLNCHASTYVAMFNLGEGDLDKGFEKLNAMDYHQGLDLVKHPVSCIDCHHPQTMQLRLTRPAFIEGLKKLKTSQGLVHFDVDKDITHNEMRSFVCAQCHVEYYFKGEEKRLTYPWSEGIKADEMLSYYEKNPHYDWIHPKTDAKMLKAQHPEFELWSQGVHAKAGVSCVDCHMPYQRSGAHKVTNHHIRSPLLNINKSCQTCHNRPEAEILEQVELIQTRHYQMRNQVMDALVELIEQIEKNKNKLPAQKLKKIQKLHTQSQFLIDFVEAENSMGFHAPQEAARLMVKALDMIRQAQNMLSLKDSTH
jgi:nitrite reductase (cytochrome c-552)